MAIISEKNSLSIAYIKNMFLPFINMQTYINTFKIYFGITPILLVIYSFFRPNKERLFLLIICTIFFLAGFGQKLLIYNIFSKILPFFKMLRLNHLIIFITYFFLIFLIIKGFEDLAVFLKKKIRIQPVLISSLVISILIFELFSYGINSLKIDRFDPLNNIIAQFNNLKIKDNNDIYRIFYSPKDSLINNFSEQFTAINWPISSFLESTGGYGAMIYFPYIEYIYYNTTKKALTNEPIDLANLIQFNYFMPQNNIDSNMMKLLNIKYIGDFNTKNNTISFKLNKNYLPRAFLVDTYKLIPQKHEKFKYMSSLDFEPLKEVVLNEGIPGFSKGEKRENIINICRIKYNTPDCCIIQCQSDKDKILFISQINYPGWNCYVNNVKTKIYSADYIFMAVPLLKGSCVVEIRYEPFSYKLGAIISLVSILFALAGYFYCKKSEA